MLMNTEKEALICFMGLSLPLPPSFLFMFSLFKVDLFVVLNHFALTEKNTFTRINLQFKKETSFSVQTIP